MKKNLKKILNNSITYDDMSWVLDFYKVDNKFRPKKGYIYISDYALIHKPNEHQFRIKSIYRYNY